MNMSKRVSENQPAFYETFKHLRDGYGITKFEALMQVDGSYRDFMRRNESLSERQTDASNHADSELTTQSIVISTATLTFSSALIGVVVEKVTFWLALLYLATAIVCIISIASALANHLLTRHFHSEWAKMYHTVATEVIERVEKGEIQKISELGDIEGIYLENMPQQSPKWPAYAAVITAVVGLVLFLFLVIIYFSTTLAY
jgi:hypothetical protein